MPCCATCDDTGWVVSEGRASRCLCVDMNPEIQAKRRRQDALLRKKAHQAKRAAEKRREAKQSRQG